MNTKTKIKNRVTVAKDINFNHARVDPSHCFADGLFQPILHGKRTALPLDVAYKYQSVIFRWQHPTTRLCIKDQSVFVAVLRIASDKTRAIKVDLGHQDLDLQKARNGLNLQLDANNLECLVITTTAREIAHTLDLKISGPAIARIQESLERLAGVSFSISHKQSEVTFWKTNMFSVVSTDGPNRLIAINPCLSKALVSSPTVFIDMNEQKELSSDVAKRIHLWLSAWLRPTECGTIGIDLIVTHVWGDTSSGSTLHSRRHSVKVALAEICGKTVWRCDFQQEKMNFIIHRKKLGDYSTLAAREI